MCSPQRARFNAVRGFFHMRLVEEISVKYYRKLAVLRFHKCAKAGKFVKKRGVLKCFPRYWPRYVKAHWYQCVALGELF